MKRPRIICHMHTLLNGKVDGIANITDVGMRAQKLYFDIMLGDNRFYTGHRGWLSGSGTSEAMMVASRSQLHCTSGNRSPPVTSSQIRSRNVLLRSG